ncbi:MAG: choice-of-anchor D domain-containing protein [Candidatus Marithrix sp.]
MNQIPTLSQMAVLFIILLNSMAAWADGIIQVSINGNLSNGTTMVGLKSTIVGTAGSTTTINITNAATDGSTLNITDIIVPDGVIVSTTAFSLTDNNTGTIKKTFTLNIAATATTNIKGNIIIVNDAFSDNPVSGKNPNNFTFGINGYVKGTGIINLTIPTVADINKVIFTAIPISTTTVTTTINCNIVGIGTMTSFNPTSIPSWTDTNTIITVNLSEVEDKDIVKCTLTNSLDTISGSPANFEFDLSLPPAASINLFPPTTADVTKAIFTLTPSVATTALTTVNCNIIGSGSITSFTPTTIPTNTATVTAITTNLIGIVNNDKIQCSLTNPIDTISGSPASYTFNLGSTLPELDIWEGGIEVKHGNSINFGTTKVGSPIEKQIILKNTSNATLSIYDINPPKGFKITSTNLNFTILPNQELAVNVLLEATEAGNFNSSFTIASNDGDNGDGVENPYTFLAQGIIENLASPRVQVLDGITPIDEIKLGLTTIGTPLAKILTIKNTGNSNLTLAITTIGNGFSIIQPSSQIIPPNATTNFTVSLDTATIGNYTSIISITNNSDINPINIVASGEIKPNVSNPEIEEVKPNTSSPEIQVFNGMVEIIDGATTPINIGTTTVGQPITKRFRMKNIGTEAIDLYGYSAPNGFNITNIYPTGLAIDEEFTFDIQLNTLIIGTFNGPIELYNSDADESPFNFIISGTVTNNTVINPANPEIQVFDEQLEIISDTNISTDFGIAALGTNMTKTFTVKNVGTSTLILNSPVTTQGSGFNINSFMVPTELNPGESTTFDVILNASNVGNFVDILSFNNNDIDESLFTFPISGTVSKELRDETNCFEIGLISGGVCVVAQPFNVINATGGITDTQIKGGLSVYQNGKFSAFTQSLTINQFTSVLTAGVIKTDSKYIGKKVDIMVIGYHVAQYYLQGYQWYQLASCTTCPLGWKVLTVASDETTAIPLLTKENLSPLMTVNKMPEYLTVDMYSGAFRIIGQLDMYLAYRIEEGTDKGKIIVTSPGINIILLDN